MSDLLASISSTDVKEVTLVVEHLEEQLADIDETIREVLARRQNDITAVSDAIVAEMADIKEALELVRKLSKQFEQSAKTAAAASDASTLLATKMIRLENHKKLSHAMDHLCNMLRAE